MPARHGRRGAAALAALAALTPSSALAADPAASSIDRAPRGAPRAPAAARQLRDRLGDQGVVAEDPATGTPRVVARLDGFLTAPSARTAAQVALGFVRARPGLFGLDAGDLGALRLVRRNTTPDGSSHLLWRQTYKGIPVLDAQL